MKLRTLRRQPDHAREGASFLFEHDDAAGESCGPVLPAECHHRGGEFAADLVCLGCGEQIESEGGELAEARAFELKVRQREAVAEAEASIAAARRMLFRAEVAKYVPALAAVFGVESTADVLKQTLGLEGARGVVDAAANDTKPRRAEASPQLDLLALGPREPRKGKP